MPVAEYEHRTDSVLAWKKAQKLGRFDPNAPSIEQQKIRASEREVEERGKRNTRFRFSFFLSFLHVSDRTNSYHCGDCAPEKQFWELSSLRPTGRAPAPSFERMERTCFKPLTSSRLWTSNSAAPP